MLFHLANLPYWIFIAIGVILLLMVIVSGGGDEDIDIDADVDVDLDIEVESGIIALDSNADFAGETEMDANTGDGFTPMQVLTWLGVGKSPLILLLATDFSVWGLSGWTFNLIISSITGQIPSRLWGMGGLVMLSSLIIALGVGSLVSRPLGKIFASFGEDVSSDRFIGCIGKVSSKNVPYLIDGRVGQADVSDLAHNSVSISVSLPPWATVVPHHGQQVLIIDRQQHSYIVIAKDSSDEDKWLSSTSLTNDS